MGNPAQALLRDGFERIKQVVGAALNGIDSSALGYQADPDANTVAWLVWHLARVQDDHVSELTGRPQAWVDDGWSQKFDLPFDDDETGYGQSVEQMRLVRTSAENLLGYFEAVHARTAEFLDDLSGNDLDRIVDAQYDPPVTVGVRLVSVLTDDLQHAGQAAYVRGLAERSGR